MSNTNIFLLNGTRFKLCRHQNGMTRIPIPPELHGRWVALVAADDDRHLHTYYVLKNYDTIQELCTAQLDDLRQLRTERKQLADALIKYGKHEELCDSVLTKHLVLPCSCGFSAALDEALDTQRQR